MRAWRWRLGRRCLSVIAAMGMAAGLHALNDESGVLLRRHSRQLAQEGDGRPDLLIAVISPSRHAGHLDAVLDDPEHLAAAIELCRNRKVGRRGVKAVGDVALGDAGCAVAHGAMRREMLDTHRDFRRVVQTGWDPEIRCMRLDRAYP